MEEFKALRCDILMLDFIFRKIWIQHLKETKHICFDTREDMSF